MLANRRLSRVRRALTAGARTIDTSRGSGGAQRGTDMPSSGILDLAIGLAFVFGATAALSSVGTELIARCLGLRGAYLLRGLRELLDGEDASMNLATARVQYDAVKDLITGDGAAAEAEATGAKAAAATGAAAARPERSATATLLGGPILRSQGMVGDISSRKLQMRPAKKRPAKKRRRGRAASQAGGPAGPADAASSLAGPADAAIVPPKPPPAASTPVPPATPVRASEGMVGDISRWKLQMRPD